jgi:hypothetical protein
MMKAKASISFTSAVYQSGASLGRGVDMNTPKNIKNITMKK